MQFVGRMFSSVSEFYKDINPSTLSGAVDIIIIEHNIKESDGSTFSIIRRCSPFHVRFGKLQLLRPSEKRVEIAINGQVINGPGMELEDEVAMKVGESGETYFVLPVERGGDGFARNLDTHALLTSPLAKTRVIKPDNRGVLSDDDDLSKRGLIVGDDQQTILVPPSLPRALSDSELDVLKTEEKLGDTMPPVIEEKELTITKKPSTKTSWNWPWSSTTNPPSTPVATQGLPNTRLELTGAKSFEFYELLESEACLATNYALLNKLLFSNGNKQQAKTLLPEAKIYQIDRGVLFIPTTPALFDNKTLIDSVEAFQGKALIINDPLFLASLLDDYGMQCICVIESIVLPLDLALIALNGWMLFKKLPTLGHLESIINPPWYKSPKTNVAPAQPLENSMSMSINTSASEGGRWRQWWPIKRQNGQNLNPNPNLKEKPPNISIDGTKSEVKTESNNKPQTVTNALGNASTPPISDDSALSHPQPSRSPTPSSIANPNPNPHVATRVYYTKSLRLPSKTLCRLPLHPGLNNISFTVATKLQGRATCNARIFLLSTTAKLVISDVDGTITKSDALGHLFTIVGKDWTHPDIASLYTRIVHNGYQMVYLTSRAIGQAQYTRAYLQGVTQADKSRTPVHLPDGPLIMSPDRLFTALRREVIVGNPEEFKIAALRDIARLFSEDGAIIEVSKPQDSSFGAVCPSSTCFYAGFGNRQTDKAAYQAVGIPAWRIFTVNPAGTVDLGHSRYLTHASYGKIIDLVDALFPPEKGSSTSASAPMIPEFSDYMFWSHPLQQPIKLQQQVIEELGPSPKPGSDNSANNSLLQGILPPEAMEAIRGGKDKPLLDLTQELLPGDLEYELDEEPDEDKQQEGNGSGGNGQPSATNSNSPMAIDEEQQTDSSSMAMGDDQVQEQLEALYEYEYLFKGNSKKNGPKFEESRIKARGTKLNKQTPERPLSRHDSGSETEINESPLKYPFTY